jgi:hypothetical protein
VAFIVSRWPVLRRRRGVPRRRQIGWEEARVEIEGGGSRFVAKQAGDGNDGGPGLDGERCGCVAQVVGRELQTQCSGGRIEAIAAKIAVSKRC